MEPIENNNNQTPKIDLGFADPWEHPFKSRSKYFPSKIGGKPSFLRLNPIVGPEQITCPKCDKIMKFMLQIYAPIEVIDDTFHRTLFLFGCTNGCNEFTIHRSQLGRENSFYSSQPPDFDADMDDNPDYDPNPELFDIKLCFICGVKGDKQCSQCRMVNYCSRDHQVLDWKYGHKDSCAKNRTPRDKLPVHLTLFPGKFFFIYKFVNFCNCVMMKIFVPEFEIVLEPLSTLQDDLHPDVPRAEDDGEVEEDEMFRYKEYLATHKPSMQNENMEDYNVMDDEESQVIFDNFKTVTKEGEVVRYRRSWYDDDQDSNPDILWISNKNQIQTENIPVCENCGNKRKFECQVTPHLLNKILLGRQSNICDNVDFGTLLIYSCPKSCTTKGYVKEFIHNQPVA